MERTKWKETEDNLIERLIFEVNEKIDGPIHKILHSRLIDNNNSSVFDIETSGDSIDIYPVEQADIGSYIKFYEFLVENVDSQAVVG